MLLNDLYASINAKVATVNSIVNSITRINYDVITTKLAISKGYTDKIYWAIYDTTAQRFFTTYLALSTLIESYESLVAQYSSSIVSIRNAVQASLATYYSAITYQIEQAIYWVWEQVHVVWVGLDRRIRALEAGTGGTVGVTLEQVNALINQAKVQVTLALQAEMDTMEQGLIVNIDAVERDLGQELEWIQEDVWEIEETFEEVLELDVETIWTTITDTATQIYTWTEGHVKDAVAIVGNVITNVTTWATEQFNLAIVALENVKSYLFGYINDSFRSLFFWVKSNLEIIMGLLDDVFEYAIEGVMVVYNELKSLYDELALLIDWRFVFLKLFIAYPELTFLQIINRNQAEFERFRPYWQAFLVRVDMP